MAKKSVPDSGSPQRLCSLCRQNAADSGSHIIPRALHRDLLQADDDFITEVPEDPDERERISRTGVSDDGILCRACERRFNTYDGYLINALRSEPVAATRWFDRDSMEIPGADYAQVKLGLMHLLWRMHASTRPAYAGWHLEAVDAERLRELLLTDQAGTADEFAVLMMRFDPDPEFDMLAASPRVGAWPGGALVVQWHYRRWYISVNGTCKGLPADLRRFGLEPGRPLLVTRAGSFRENPAFKAAVESFRKRMLHQRGNGGDSVQRNA